ncbi:hypothetical protein [Microcoleus sp. B4-D4]|uniref:hypothetical protein n=1 Tax=Microcoleus sp. B4-D4 TaxID=2818667 RepID=UPI002FD3A453
MLKEEGRRKKEEGRGERADRAIDKTPPIAIALNPLLIRFQHHFRLCQFCI